LACPKDWRAQPPIDVATFFADGADAFVITTDEHLPQLGPYLPSGVKVIATARYFFQDRDLVLLGRTGTRTAQRSPSPGRVRRANARLAD
jgi:hypothetical protein